MSDLRHDDGPGGCLLQVRQLWDGSRLQLIWPCSGKGTRPELGSSGLAVLALLPVQGIGEEPPNPSRESGFEVAIGVAAAGDAPRLATSERHTLEALKVLDRDGAVFLAVDEHHGPAGGLRLREPATQGDASPYPLEPTPRKTGNRARPVSVEARPGCCATPL